MLEAQRERKEREGSRARELETSWSMGSRRIAQLRWQDRKPKLCSCSCIRGTFAYLISFSFGHRSFSRSRLPLFPLCLAQSRLIESEYLGGTREIEFQIPKGDRRPRNTRPDPQAGISRSRALPRMNFDFTAKEIALVRKYGRRTDTGGNPELPVPYPLFRMGNRIPMASFYPSIDLH